MFNKHIFQKQISTQYIGRKIQFYDELASTNTKSWELISQNLENGTIIITDNQTAGHGRQSNQWFSAKGKSLTFSIILYPNAKPDVINYYSLIAGLAINDALLENNIQSKLKWPNDVLINEKKVCGILCESKITGGLITSLVIGIGLNVNNMLQDFPLDIKNTATSIFIESGDQLQIESLLSKIICHLENRINNISSNSINLRDWESQCAHLNKNISFYVNNKTVNGIFKGLSRTGQAILDIDGEKILFNNGEIL